MDHAIISNAKVIHVVLLPHLSSPSTPPPSSILHTSTIGGCGCRSALGPGPKGCATLRLMILHSDDQIRKGPTTAAAGLGKSDHCDAQPLVSFYFHVKA